MEDKKQKNSQQSDPSQHEKRAQHYTNACNHFGHGIKAKTWPVSKKISTRAQDNALHQHVKDLVTSVAEHHQLNSKEAAKVVKTYEAFYTMHQNQEIKETISNELKHGDMKIKQEEQSDLPLTENQITEYQSAAEKRPQWFQALHYPEQQALLKIIEEKNPMTFIPSSLRSIPGCANHSHHVLEITKNGKTEKYLRIRSSALSPIDIKDSTERARICKLNVEQLIEEGIQAVLKKERPNETSVTMPILLQTLLSPSALNGIIGDNDGDMVMQVRQAAIKYIQENPTIDFEVDNKKYVVKPQLLCINHSINQLRRENWVGWVLGRPDTHTPQDEEALIKICDKYLKKDKPNNEQLVREALKNYKLIRNGIIKINPSDWNKPMVLASLEQIMVSSMGGLASGTCKSGKDRKGLETLQTDALLCYFQEKEKLPDFSKTDKEFREIFNKLFKSGHHQKVADRNSPGARGLKSIPKVLPRNLLEEILKEDLQKEKTNAAMNKPKHKESTASKYLKIGVLILFSIPIMIIGSLITIVVVTAQNARHPTLKQSSMEAITPEKDEPHVSTTPSRNAVTSKSMYTASKATNGMKSIARKTFHRIKSIASKQASKRSEPTGLSRFSSKTQSSKIAPNTRKAV